MSVRLSFLSVDEAASVLGYTTGRIRQMLRAGILRGKKLNARAWMIDESSVESVQKLKKPGKKRLKLSPEKNS